MPRGRRVIGPSFPHLVVPRPSAVAAYVGPGDLAGFAPAVMFCGLRAYTAGQIGAGAQCVKVNSNGNNAINQEIGILANGIVDAAAADAFIAANTAPGEIYQVWDQAAFGSPDIRNNLVLTGGAVPLWSSTAGPGGVYPAWQYTTGGQTLNTTFSINLAQPQPLTVAMVGRLITYGSSGQILYNDSNLQIVFNFLNSHNAYAIYAGTDYVYTSNSNVLPTNSAPGHIVFVVNGSSSKIYVNNVDVTESSSINPGSPGFSGSDVLKQGTDLTANFTEISVWPEAWTPTQINSQYQNARTAYGNGAYF